jgi:hypothetical protein
MGKIVKKDEESKSNRRMEVCRRDSNDRRKQQAPVAVERRTKVQRRRQIDPTTCERDYNAEEIEFMQAMDAYKRASGRMFPTCSEILEVIRGMGYVKAAPAAEVTPAPITVAVDAAATPVATL